MGKLSVRLHRVLSRVRYAAIGGAIGGAVGAVLSKKAASTGAAIGALVGATFGETQVTARSQFDRVKERGEEELKRIPLE
ncbi:YMGG-like glycine zipper-containing protein [Haloprofundus salinisoli]|uniref:YMGG-like glycine zipper-containing protein n=1 Tax=Haloprofundus salinisoli TaxID=2876193 RepID=UPI001CCFBC0F|nr:YMGG-like glycine zipper-containing protein [Haloprofundus salinisoli]